MPGECGHLVRAACLELGSLSLHQQVVATVLPSRQHEEGEEEEARNAGAALTAVQSMGHRRQSPRASWWMLRKALLT